MRRMKKLVLGLVLSLLCVGSALALDVNDITNLIRSGVKDSVIINMVRSQQLDRPLTAGEILALNSNGASPTLLEFLTRPETVSSSYIAPPPVVTDSLTSQPMVYDSTPTVVTSDPTVIVTTPPTVYYDYDYYDYGYPYYSGYYDYWPGYSWGWGGYWWGGSRHGYRYRDRDRPHGRPPHGGGYRPGGRPGGGYSPGGRPGGSRPSVRRGGGGGRGPGGGGGHRGGGPRGGGGGGRRR